MREITHQMEEGAVKPKPKVLFEQGEQVKVIDGPFQDFNGVVEEVKPEKGKLRVLISIFGRATPVELDFVQVEKACKRAWRRRSSPRSSCRSPPARRTRARRSGPALGQRGVNIMEFCKAFNAQTQAQAGLIIPVVITVYADRSFTFITKTPPASVLLKQRRRTREGLGRAGQDEGREGHRAQVEEIAQLKMPDLTAGDSRRR